MRTALRGARGGAAAQNDAAPANGNAVAAAAPQTQASASGRGANRDAAGSANRDAAGGANRDAAGSANPQAAPAAGAQAPQVGAMPGAAPTGARAGASGRGGRIAASGDVRPAVVFIQGDNGIEPRSVMLGVNDWDHTEVLRGLEAGELVVLISVARLQQQQQDMLNRMRERNSGVFPGGGTGGPPGGRR
jgi:HlyD family secretion protein